MTIIRHLLIAIQLFLSLEIMAMENEFEPVNLTEESSLNIQTLQDVTANPRDQQAPFYTCAFQLGQSQTCWGLGWSQPEKQPTVSVSAIICFSVSTAVTTVIGMATNCSLLTACPIIGTLPFIYQCCGITPYHCALFNGYDEFGNDFVNGYNHGYPGLQCKQRFCSCF